MNTEVEIEELRKQLNKLVIDTDTVLYKEKILKEIRMFEFFTTPLDFPKHLGVDSDNYISIGWELCRMKPRLNIRLKL